MAITKDDRAPRRAPASIAKPKSSIFYKPSAATYTPNIASTRGNTGSTGRNVYTPVTNYSGGGGGGGYGGGGSYDTFAAPPPPPPPPNKEDWIASDAGYKAQRDALAKALADYQTNYDAEINQYDVDYQKGIRTLGWDSQKLDDPTTKENEGIGKWNTEDQTRSSGRSYQNQLNDFASRNLLQSSLYAQAVNDLMRSLDEQLGNINTSRMNFRNDKGRALTSYKTDNESQRNLAYADAASRYAALFGV